MLAPFSLHVRFTFAVNATLTIVAFGSHLGYFCVTFAWWEFRIADRLCSLHFRSIFYFIFAVNATLTIVAFWVTFGLFLCHFWITLEHKVTASRSWALGARCEDYPSCHGHFARRAGTTRRMGHAHFARWAGTTCGVGHDILPGGPGLPDM